MKKRFIFLLGIFLLVNLLSITLLEEKVLGKEKEEVTICIDAGHQEKGDKKLEPIAPWSNEKSLEYLQEQLELVQKIRSMK